MNLFVRIRNTFFRFKKNSYLETEKKTNIALYFLINFFDTRNTVKRRRRSTTLRIISAENFNSG